MTRDTRLRRQRHNPLLAGISDVRVQYREQAKWVAKIRATQTNDARVVLITHMLAGHFGVAGRFAELDELGLIQAFALDVVDMHWPDEPVARDGLRRS